MNLRDYQTRAVEEVGACYRRVRSVCLVAPTGAGKTLLGLEVARRTLARDPTRRVLWLAHRQELVSQAIERAEVHLGPMIDRFTAATVQGLMASGSRPEATLVIADEAHHYGRGAAEWHKVVDGYAEGWMLGLTATPQRGDGSPLGDVFSEMVIAAQYGELVEAGHLVPCRVIRPLSMLDDGLAQDPVDAWIAHAEGRQGFLFGRRVDECYDYAARLRARGLRAEVIEGNTAAQLREDHLADFRGGRLDVLCSVYVLTEGVDVPAAAVCMLARSAGHTGTYLQMVGRVLRPAEGKRDAILIDLMGASYKHGLPTEDREYGLSGRAISVKQEAAEPAAKGEAREDKPLRIYSLALAEVYAGDATPAAAKRAEWDRLAAMCSTKGWGIGWAGSQYRKLFGAPPPAGWVSLEAKRKQIEDWRRLAQAKNYKAGWVGFRAKDAFGDWVR